MTLVPHPSSLAHAIADNPDLLRHRPLTLELELSLERRIRAYAERLNARLADGDPFDPSDDSDLAALITLLCESALEADEAPSPR
jgi:hypothetical protein